MKVIIMVLIHDLVEIDAGDTYAYDAAGATDKREREEKAADRIFGLLPKDQGIYFRELWEEFEAYETADAKYAHLLDNFQPVLLNDASGLGCGTKLTATEKKLTFQSIVKEVIGEDEEESDAVFGDIQENLNNMIPVTEDETVEPEPVIVTRSAIADVLAESGVTEEQAAVIENTYENVFGEELPEAGQLVDPKLVEANGKRKEKLELVKQVENLKQQLEETRSVPVSEGDADGEDVPAVKTYDVILRVKPEKVGQIHSQVIDGQKCLVIPMDEDEHAAVNGANTTV